MRVVVTGGVGFVGGAVVRLLRGRDDVVVALSHLDRGLRDTFGAD